MPVGKFTFECPAGMVDEDKNFMGVVAKELEEECGIIIHGHSFILCWEVNGRSQVLRIATEESWRFTWINPTCHSRFHLGKHFKDVRHKINYSSCLLLCQIMRICGFIP